MAESVSACGGPRRQGADELRRRRVRWEDRSFFALVVNGAASTRSARRFSAGRERRNPMEKSTEAANGDIAESIPITKPAAPFADGSCRASPGTILSREPCTSGSAPAGISPTPNVTRYFALLPLPQANRRRVHGIRTRSRLCFNRGDCRASGNRPFRQVGRSPAVSSRYSRALLRLEKR